MLSKKGAAHFEMIIAFIFFMGFVFFLFMMIKPYDTTILSGAVVSELYTSFEEKAHTNLTNVFLKANSTGFVGCFYVELPGEIFAYALTQSIVTDLADRKYASELGDSNLNIDADVIYYKVAISPDFVDENLGTCNKVSNYYLGSLLERRVISYSSLQEMSNRYYNGGYDELRVELGVPGTLDFAIFSEDISGADMKGTIPDSGEIVAKSYVTEVLYKNGTVVNGKFTLMVW